VAESGSGIAPPYPWFGGKSKAASLVWTYLGDPQVYYEPFAGALAVLLRREKPVTKEYVGDKDAFVANFWRALANDPNEVRRHVRWPMIEHDFHARVRWLTEECSIIVDKIHDDHTWYDAEIAGCWAWVVSASLHPTRWPTIGDHPRGLNNGQSDTKWNERFDRLATRVQRLHVRTSWQAAVRDQPKDATKAVFFDPPYKLLSRESRLYRSEVHDDLHTEVEQWCLDRSSDPTWRIVCAGFEGDFALEGWAVTTWSKDTRERLWVSPSCAAEGSLF
jgi:D12 class N6 adenine-specific DNA methyltransferase